MTGTVLLSHGLESGPDATKVSAMARAAESLGWRSQCLDYRDLDSTHGLAGASLRLARLLTVARTIKAPLVLAGSSFGAFISGLASLEVVTSGLFLLALPLKIPPYEPAFDCAPIPTTIIHGWDDELIPAAAVIEFAARRKIELHLVNDSHRLTGHVEIAASRFAEFLGRLES